ncbi:hypothetical protein PAHAL_5G200900 [Panicum hallii]|uniref:Uncharacterized protein n=1 Tax=Panicum hallii TaxID=206008 RepID=A0A2T8IKN5_9POAL|nr:hypothetical protein PAHAL_5G200900 [Panicum hallii]
MTSGEEQARGIQNRSALSCSSRSALRACTCGRRCRERKWGLHLEAKRIGDHAAAPIDNPGSEWTFRGIRIVYTPHRRPG